MVRSRSRSPRKVAEKRRSRSRDRERERDRERRRHHRSRSRSPRKRSRSRSPRRRPPGYKRRSRSLSRDNDVVITGTSHVSPSHVPNKIKRPNKAAKQNISVPDAAMEGKSEEEIEMMKLMGFAVFDSTKVEPAEWTLCNDPRHACLLHILDSDIHKSVISAGKHVPGTDISASNVIQKRKYRQYMNRRGGFNRPLDFIA